MTTLERYQQAKLALSAGFQTTDSLLHVHAGLAIFLAARVVFGRHRTPLIAWGIVVAVEIVNEVIDRMTYGSWRRANTTNDAVQTLFWPTALTLVRLLDRRRGKPSRSGSFVAAKEKDHGERTRTEARPVEADGGQPLRDGGPDGDG